MATLISRLSDGLTKFQYRGLELGYEGAATGMWAHRYVSETGQRLVA